MSNWISSINNPENRIIRKATSFSGSVVNFYPWPVSSNFQRLSLKGAYVLTTGPLVGTTVGAVLNSGSPTIQSESRYGITATFNPVRISITGNYDGQYDNVTGEYILNPSGFGYLRINLGTTIGPTDIYAEGYEKDQSFINLDRPRPTRVPFNRILTGTSSAITSFIKNSSPATFRPISTTLNPAFNVTGGTYVYLCSTAPFSGIQVNLGSEGYTRTKAYTLEYWNGSTFTTLTTTASTVSAWSDSDLVFHQSGIITWNKPSDWAKTTVSGDPYLLQNPSGSNMSFDTNLYYIRLVPPTPNAESVPIISITFFD